MTEFFSDRLSAHIIDLSENGNIFDAAAFAYQDIQDVLRKNNCTEDFFCAGYLKIGMGSMNPNLFKLGLPYAVETWKEKKDHNEFIKSVDDILNKYSTSTSGDEACEDCLRGLQILLFEHEKVMEDYLDKPELTHELAAYLLICAIDYYAKVYNTRCGQSDANLNVLNEFGKESILIYRKLPVDIFVFDGKEEAENKEINEKDQKKNDKKLPESLFYRKIGIDDTDQKGINENLSELFFVAADRIPKEAEISFQIYKPSEERLKGIRKKDTPKALRIAIVPFCKKEVTDFPLRAGALFYAKHEPTYDKEYGEIAVKLLESAIENECHLVIFPEYMISQGILDQLVNYLRNRHNQKRKPGNLILVCAGTRWDESSNNIGTLISAEGVILVEKYKSEPYINEIAGIIYTEDLRNPGKKIDLLDVVGFGRVQLSVCRDVCSTRFDSSHKAVFSLFHPDLVLVPAWSGSVNRGFSAAFENMSRFGAVSILGNCCEAITFVMNKLKKKAEKDGKTFEARDSLSIRVFTGVPSENDERLLKIACKYGKENDCPIGNCLIMYDLIRLKGKPEENDGRIFRIGNEELIGKDGKSPKSDKNVLKKLGGGSGSENDIQGEPLDEQEGKQR